MLALIWLVPVFVLFEIAQIIACERLIGVRQLRADGDPYQARLPRWLVALWLSGLSAYLLWMALLVVAVPRPLPQAWIWWAATLAGLWLRRSVGLRGALVVLTFESAIRLGMMTSLFSDLWRGRL